MYFEPFGIFSPGNGDGSFLFGRNFPGAFSAFLGPGKREKWGGWGVGERRKEQKELMKQTGCSKNVFLDKTSFTEAGHILRSHISQHLKNIK